jgi:hypothetical protein
MKAQARLCAIISAAVLLGGCRFGTLPYPNCIREYQPPQIEIAALANAQSGGVVQERYGFCADGRRGMDAMIPHLQAQGYSVDSPTNHIEVPGAWCVAAARAVSPATYDAAASLDTLCRMGDTFRVHLTGGTLRGADGREYRLRSLLARP